MLIASSFQVSRLLRPARSKTSTYLPCRSYSTQMAETVKRPMLWLRHETKGGVESLQI